MGLSHHLEGYHLAPALFRWVGRLRGESCRGRLHEAADFLRRTLLHIVGDMGVGVQREAGAVVAQHTGQSFHIHAVGDGKGRVGVPEIIKPYFFINARRLQQLLIDAGQSIRTPVVARPGRRE